MDKQQRVRLLKIIDLFSRYSIKIIMILIIMIIIVQTLLQVNGIRHIIVPTERWEGQSYKGS